MTFTLITGFVVMSLFIGVISVSLRYTICPAYYSKFYNKL